MFGELDDEIGEMEVEFAEELAELEVGGIMDMECDAFGELLAEDGIDIDAGTPESLREQMAEMDGTGTSTDILDAMEEKLHKCYGWNDDKEREPEGQLSDPVVVEEKLEKQENPENFWKRLDANVMNQV